MIEAMIMVTIYMIYVIIDDVPCDILPGGMHVHTAGQNTPPTPLSHSVRHSTLKSVKHAI